MYPLSISIISTNRIISTRRQVQLLLIKRYTRKLDKGDIAALESLVYKLEQLQGDIAAFKLPFIYQHIVREFCDFVAERKKQGGDAA